MSAIAIVDQSVLSVMNTVQGAGDTGFVYPLYPLSAMAHHESQSVHITYQVPATRRKNIAQGMPQLLYLAGS